MTAQAREQRDRDWGAGPVLEAAAALEVKEFDLFALAHRWWFGRDGASCAERDIFSVQPITWLGLCERSPTRTAPCAKVCRWA